MKNKARQMVDRTSYTISTKESRKRGKKSFAGKKNKKGKKGKGK